MADEGNVDTQVINQLVDAANPNTPRAQAPAQPVGMSDSRFEQLKELATDLFNPDPAIGSAALKKLAKLTGQEAQLEQLTAPRQPEPEPEPEPVGSGAEHDSVLDLAMDYYTDYLNRGVSEAMRSPEIAALRDAAKRLKGDKFDEAKWTQEVRGRIENRVVDGFTRLNAAGQKIQARSLDKVLSGATDDILGLIRSTIGDPTGIGRHASAQAPLPGSDIPEERTRLPSLQDVEKDPYGATRRATEANEAAFAKKLAMLRAGADGTSA